MLQQLSCWTRWLCYIFGWLPMKLKALPAMKLSWSKNGYWSGCVHFLCSLIFSRQISSCTNMEGKMMLLCIILHPYLCIRSIILHSIFVHEESWTVICCHGISIKSLWNFLWSKALWANGVINVYTSHHPPLWRSVPDYMLCSGFAIRHKIFTWTNMEVCKCHYIIAVLLIHRFCTNCNFRSTS